MTGLLAILKQTLRQSYHNAGLVVGLSALWVFLLIPFITIGPATAGIYFIFNRVVHRKPVSLSDILPGIRRFGIKGLKIFMIYFMLTGAALINIYLALNYESLLFTVIAYSWILILVFAAMTAIYIFPFLVETSEDVLTVFKKSAVLVLDNLFFSLGVLLINTLIFLFFTILPPLFVLFCFGFLSIFNTNLLIFLLEKYQES